MNKITKTAVVAASTALIGSGLAVASTAPAHADNTAISIEKAAKRSASGKILNVKATVVCSDETTDAWLSATVYQTNAAGGTQRATAAIHMYGAVECTGDEEQVTIAVRRPTGGYNWRAGEAAVRNVSFTTKDPSGVYMAFLKARTVRVS